MSMITATGLRKSYASDGAVVSALNGADLEIERGEFLAVMGPSGSGKSTLLHMLGALDVPDEGEVIFAGRELSGLDRAELALVRRRRVGFVFQLFNLVPVLTVDENVRLPLVLDRTSQSEVRERADEVLDALGLSAQRGKLPSQLSGGEQQRAAIARAAIHRPDVVLADEPTGNLDRANGREVMTYLARLNDAGQAIVVVTHDPMVAAYAKRVVFMRDGRLVDETRVARRGSTASILSKLAELEEERPASM